ncbi:MAG: hypothetical protein FWH27_14070 [Planctomycetaceae bacterium]|nr:hypothetical protein [Planctomycetaceae bacterium]
MHRNVCRLPCKKSGPILLPPECHGGRTHKTTIKTGDFTGFFRTDKGR